MNAFIQALSREGVIIFDAAKILSDDTGKLKQQYSFDTLHLNEQGYQALNAEFIKILEELEQESP